MWIHIVKLLYSKVIFISLSLLLPSCAGDCPFLHSYLHHANTEYPQSLFYFYRPETHKGFVTTAFMTSIWLLLNWNISQYFFSHWYFFFFGVCKLPMYIPCPHFSFWSVCHFLIIFNSFCRVGTLLLLSDMLKIAIHY